MEFTQKAQKALMLAKKKSKENHHNYIGTEHILVGLLREGNGTAAKVLTAMGVEEKKLMILNVRKRIYYVNMRKENINLILYL